MTIRLTSLDLSIFAAYLLAIVVLGTWAARRGKATKRDYFLSGDKLSWWMIGGSIVASNISTHQMVGLMGTAYDRGFVALVNEWGAVLIGLNALLWIFLPFYLRNGFYTVPEFLQKRFGGGARATYAVLILLTYVFVEISGVLYLGGVTLYQLLGVPILWSAVVLGVFTGLYTILGGLRAVIWTEMAQLAVLLVGGTVLAVATLVAAGGWPAVVESSQNWHLLPPASDPDFPWTQYLGMALCVSTFYWAGNQFIVQRVLAARSEWDARMGIVVADYLKFLLPLVTCLPGILAYRLLPELERPDLVFPTLVQTLLPSGLAGLVMAGVIAAVMSHVSGAVNSCTTIATMDIYLPYLRPRASEAEAVRFGRIIGVVILLFGIFWVTLLIPFSKRPIFVLLMNAYGYFAPGIATMFLLGIFWKRATHAGALAAGLLSIPLSLALELGYPELAALWQLPVTSLSFANRTGIVFWVCVAVCILVSLLTKPKPEAELAGLIWNRQSLSLPAGQEQHSRGLRNPVIWWALITGIILFFYAWYH